MNSAISTDTGTCLDCGFESFRCTCGVDNARAADGWRHRRWVEHDFAANIYKTLVENLSEGGAKAVLGNLFEVIQEHPDERTAKRLWYHLRIHSR